MQSLNRFDEQNTEVIGFDCLSVGTALVGNNRMFSLQVHK